MTKSINIMAGARELKMHGTVPIYLDSRRNWRADHSLIWATAKDLPSGSTVIDVGANIGLMCCSLAVQRPDLSIIAIEPVPDNVECLRQNVAENSIPNVEIIHAAVSDKPGTMRLSNNGPWSAVLEHGEVSVRAVSLDQFLDRNVTYVKIDVEGWEPYVIAGGNRLFPKYRPRVLMEWNTWCLLRAHHDPISFARAVWNGFDVKEVYFHEKPQGAPKSSIDIVHDNITKHGSVSDILMRPREAVEIPRVEDMIYSPRHFQLTNQLP